MPSEPSNQTSVRRRSIRSRLLRRLGVRSDDQGLATTETVILTAFLVVVATTGGLIIYNAMKSNAAGIGTAVTNLPAVTPTT